MNLQFFKGRRFIVRSILVVIYCALLVLMLVTGKQHTILIDNKDAPDGSYSAIDGMEVQINSLESAEYYPGDRDKADVKGQKHKIIVDLFMEGRVEERTFTVPFGQDMVLLSVPKMLANIEPWIEPFTVRMEQAQSSDQDSEESGQFGGYTAPTEEEALLEASKLE